MTSTSVSKRSSAPVLLTFAVLLAGGVLLALPFVGDGWQGGGLAGWARFFGRLHPLLLHVPIGVFALVTMVECSRMFRRTGGRPQWSTTVAVSFGAFFAVVAALAGFLLARSGGYGVSEILTRHMWGGLAFAALALLTCLIRAWTDFCDGNPSFYRLVLFLSAGTMCFAGHNGGSLTRGASYLAEAVPEPLHGWLDLPAAKSSQKKRNAIPLEKCGVYADLVAPVLERRCTQCHSAAKAKSKLRLDAYAMLLQGGSEGPAIEPGNAAKSRMIVRMALPENDEDRMPPGGRPGLDASELAVVTWWIQAGADPEKNVTDSHMPPDIQAAARQILSATDNGR